MSANSVSSLVGTSLAQPLVVEVLSRLLARHTQPGEGRLILSAAELDGRLRAELEKSLRPGDTITDAINEAALRRLRNELVHRPLLDFEAEQVSTVMAALNAAVQGTSAGLDDVGKRHGETESGVSSAEAVAEAFLEELISGSVVLGKLDGDEAVRLGRRAAEQVLASAQWSQVVGDRLDTTQVSQMLGVTRQALNKRQQSGSLLGLVGDGTTWFPTWQFDLEDGAIRPEVRDIVGAFRDRLDDVDPLLVASWATTNQDEDLAGETPAQWLCTGRNSDQLRRAAERAASRLAR